MFPFVNELPFFLVVLIMPPLILIILLFVLSRVFAHFSDHDSNRRNDIDAKEELLQLLILSEILDLREFDPSFQSKNLLLDAKCAEKDSSEVKRGAKELGS